MHVIKTKYKGQGEGVIGHAFDALNDAERFLEDNGWERDEYNESLWTKVERTVTMGCIGIDIASYVYIGKE